MPLFVVLFNCFLNLNFSSHKAGDYNSCPTENDVATCLIVMTQRKELK